MRQIAGVLGWAPRDLDAATLPELIQHFEGWQLSHGQGPGQRVEPMTRDELEELMARFPDEPLTGNLKQLRDDGVKKDAADG